MSNNHCNNNNLVRLKKFEEIVVNLLAVKSSPPLTTTTTRNAPTTTRTAPTTTSTAPTNNDNDNDNNNSTTTTTPKITESLNLRTNILPKYVPLPSLPNDEIIRLISSSLVSDYHDIASTINTTVTPSPNTVTTEHENVKKKKQCNNNNKSKWPFDILPESVCLRHPVMNNGSSREGGNNNGKPTGDRAIRKEGQIISLLRCIFAMLPLSAFGPPDNDNNNNSSNNNNNNDRIRIIDFAGGSGHLALPLALLLPKCDIILVDLKASSLELVHTRANGLIATATNNNNSIGLIDKTTMDQKDEENHVVYLKKEVLSSSLSLTPVTVVEKETNTLEANNNNRNTINEKHIDSINNNIDNKNTKQIKSKKQLNKERKKLHKKLMKSKNQNSGTNHTRNSPNNNKTSTKDDVATSTNNNDPCSNILRKCNTIPNLLTFHGSISSYVKYQQQQQQQQQQQKEEEAKEQHQQQPQNNIESKICFHIGVSLHACGEATDIMLKACGDVGANFIACPCCVGKLNHNNNNNNKINNNNTNNNNNSSSSSGKGKGKIKIVDPYVYHATGLNIPTITYPQSLAFGGSVGDGGDGTNNDIINNNSKNVIQRTNSNERNDSNNKNATNNQRLLTPEQFGILASAADYSNINELRTNRNTTRRAAKGLLEMDRLLFMKEHFGYKYVVLTKLDPWECSCKNDILMGWGATTKTVVSKIEHVSKLEQQTIIPAIATTLELETNIDCSVHGPYRSDYDGITKDNILPPLCSEANADIVATILQLLVHNKRMNPSKLYDIYGPIVTQNEDEVGAMVTMEKIKRRNDDKSDNGRGMDTVDDRTDYSASKREDDYQYQADWTSGEEETCRKTLLDFFFPYNNTEVEIEIEEEEKTETEAKIKTGNNVATIMLIPLTPTTATTTTTATKIATSSSLSFDNYNVTNNNAMMIVKKFPVGMTSRKRKLIHYVAETMKLDHWSEKVKNRKIAVVGRRGGRGER